MDAIPRNPSYSASFSPLIFLLHLSISNLSISVIKYVFFQRRRLRPHLRITLDPPGLDPGMRQSVSLHTWHHHSPCNPSSCATFMPKPHWGRVATGKKNAYIYVGQVTSVMSNSLQPCRLWPPRLLLGTRVLQARILECIGQYWLPYTSRALYFLLP